MLKAAWAVLVLVLLAGCAAQVAKGPQGPQGPRQGLTLFEDEGHWGYRDASGNVLIPPRYVAAEEFSQRGIAAVADEVGWAYIDTWGRTVIVPYVFDDGPDPFSEGLARFVKDGKMGFFDESGQVAIGPRFDFAMPFHEGLAAACEGCRLEARGEHSEAVGGMWGFVTRSGRWVIEPAYEAAGEFDGGEARVKRDGAWFTINRKGEAIEVRK